MEHFKGKNLAINFSIAFIPAIFVTVVLLDSGAPKGLANALPIVSFVYLVGLIRGKLKGKTKKKADLKPNESKTIHLKKGSVKKRAGLLIWILSFFFILLITAGWFYWHEVRPVKIRSFCSQLATEKATIKKEDQDQNLLDSVPKFANREKKDIFNSEEYEIYYYICLNENGLR